MINGKRVLAIVPARGGSKGIPKKNLIHVAGKSLIAHVAEVALAINEIDKCIVSTDSPEIAKKAVECGLDAPFLRPEELSGDFVGDWDVLYHSLTKMEQLDSITYDYVLMLQPTSPLRKPSDILGCLNLLINKDHSSVWSLSKTDLKYHPLKQLSLNDTDMEHHDPAGKDIIARQQLTDLYHRNGVVYSFTRDCILKAKNIIGDKPGGFLLKDEHVSIDTLDDVKKIERLFQSRTAYLTGEAN
ncbi:acylneuraminate cytidylyltransferase family protein [Amylibacter sp.]|nr:acylneuraminate cytidylyltransferase family protein [Amylibacter sp.]